MPLGLLVAPDRTLLIPLATKSILFHPYIIPHKDIFGIGGRSAPACICYGLEYRVAMIANFPPQGAPDAPRYSFDFSGTPDPEDIEVGTALASMQQITDRHFRAIGRSIDDLPSQEQAALVDRISPYLDFELQASEGIWQGMPLAAKGVGAILLFDEEGNASAVQTMDERDAVVGAVDGVCPYPVPSRHVTQDSPGVEPGEEVVFYEKSFSATVLLRQAQFHTPNREGRCVL